MEKRKREKKKKRGKNDYNGENSLNRREKNFLLIVFKFKIALLTNDERNRTSIKSLFFY